MKREIKFRAWVKSRKVMCKVDALDFPWRQVRLSDPVITGTQMNFDKQKKTAHRASPTRTTTFSVPTHRTAFRTIELLQYTNLKDKNGKEIYEGDIIIEDDPLGENRLEIFWDDKLSGFQGRFDIYHGPMPETKSIEVIGNIYENPELLKT